MNERRARRVASEFNLQPLGLLGILSEAKQHRLLQECKPVLDEIIQIAGFWIGERLYKQFLAAVDESMYAECGSFQDQGEPGHRTRRTECRFP